MNSKKKKRYVAMKIMELISNVVTRDVSSALLVQLYFSFGLFVHEAVARVVITALHEHVMPRMRRVALPRLHWRWRRRYLSQPASPAPYFQHNKYPGALFLLHVDVVRA